MCVCIGYTILSSGGIISAVRRGEHGPLSNLHLAARLLLGLERERERDGGESERERDFSEVSIVTLQSR